MNSIKLHFFEEIDLVKDFFEAKYTTSNGKEISLAIDFESEKPTENAIKSISTFLESIEINTQNIKDRLLSSEFANEVIDYIQHHLEELKDEPEIQAINSSEQFIEKLKVSSINIYPTIEERFFAFDFTINEKLTNYLLVVDLLEDLSISYVTTES